MKKSSVKFWGVRGSIPVPGQETLRTGGNTSCVEVRADDEIIILDAGTGIRPLGLSLAKEFQGIPMNLTLLISHTHWDHIQGFPFFLPAYNPANKLHIRGYEGARAKFSTILSAQMESPYFPVEMNGLPANIDVEELKEFEFSVGAVKVKSRLLNHPGVCAGYRLETSGGSIAYLPDTEPQVEMRNALQAAGKAQPSETLDRARREDDALVEFFRGVDALIIDSQYTAAEYREHVGWGHASAETVTRLAMQAQVKRLFLFHHDPGHDDHQIDELVKEARELAKGSGLEVDAAREGLLVEL
ncbi:MAG TPA: MBL fold metallo-hydrolase [Chthoniobacterales bacterium]